MTQNCVRRPMMMLNSDKNNSKTRKVYRASIEHASGRKNIADSGYFRLLIASNPNNDSYNDIKKDIAKLVSKIHSASIINGNILVTEYIANHIYNSNLPNYRDIPITHIDELCEGHYTHLKFYINGKNIEVELITMIRKEKKFPSAAELIKQIEKDKSYFAGQKTKH